MGIEIISVGKENYMNSIINNAFRNISIAIATLLLVAVSFAIAPKAHAADDELMGVWPDEVFDGGDMGVWPDSDSDMGVWPDSYSYDTGSYGGGYSYGGGFTGGSTMGGSSYRQAPGYAYQPQYTSPSNTNIWDNGNTYTYAPSETCTAVNSCNSYWDDHSIFNAPTTIVTNNPAPQTIVYAQQPPVYTQPAPVYTPTYYPAQRPIAYNNTPYVTLAAVPYTGLELGPVGTALYWGFLVLWCLLAAYLIVVKKIQNKIAAWFTGSPQNSTAQKSSDLPSSGALRATPAGQTFVRQNFAPKLAGIDPFILGQISRAK